MCGRCLEKVVSTSMNSPSKNLHINFVYFVMIFCKMPYYVSACQARLAHFCFRYSSGKYSPFTFDVDTNPYAIYEHVLVSAR